MVREVSYYSRMALGVCRLLRTPPAPDPEGLIRQQLENRQAIFLDTVRRVIFANPVNPYYQMFQLAGCGYEDLRREVERRGLEVALAEIHRQGVYLTHDEFKGKEPIVRFGEHIPSGEKSFVNPLVTGLLQSRSSGSRSVGTWNRQNTRYWIYREAREVLKQQEFSLGERARIELKAILPSAAGLNQCLLATRRGSRVERWFTAGGTVRDSGHYRIATKFLVFLCNVFGARVPYPSYLSHNDFAPVAEWIARRRAEGVPSVVSACTSPAVRVTDAALAKGLDIRGTLFLVQGEALTAAKRRVIETAGAEVYPSYPISELGAVGHACRKMKTGNCVHVFRDAVAVINYRRRAPLSEVEVDSLLFTTLLPFSPFVLVNAETDDCGTIEDTTCDCTFARAGSVQQIRDVSSYGKLTGQGVTLVGTDLIRLLEEVLPARLGGGPGDYQLVEHEDRAQTRITLRASPRVNVSSAEKIRRCFLQELRKLYGGALAARVWQHSEGVEVVMGEPFSTFTGKVHLLHLIGSPQKLLEDRR